MRKPIIAGNWKMNMTPSECAKLIAELRPLVENATCDVVVCPPFIDLAAAKEALAGSNIRLGAQNVHWADKGAFTGEVSVGMLKELGVAYAIVGHSERRQYFGETDEGVNQRARAALAGGITPIICVGESLEQREAGETASWVGAQTAAALRDMSAGEVEKVVIAYEPIWAIGTGRTATSGQADETVAIIRGVVKHLYGEAVAQAIRIQYGGSMNPKNAAELMAMPNIDGGLIGGASLKAADFSRVVNYDAEGART
ncbi:MAG TPA: triose-phosphate isomerase [Clostridia bacterium]|nr:triose-phosphate isomerase [Clostridia bacterium]